MGDTVAYPVRKKTKVAVLQDMVKDTLAVLGICKKELALYPNPVIRGTAISYSLPPGFSGEGKLEFFNSSGGLLWQKWINNTLTEVLNIPASLPEGVYFVKLSSAGAGKTYTQELVVL